MNNGYIKLHRKTLDNPVIMKNAEHVAIWIYLLLEATHKKYDVLFNGKRITLLPGQLITGRNVIAKALKVSSSNVQRILNEFEIEQQIEQQTTNKNRLITILKWNEYQTTEQQLNNKRTTTEQQLNTNNNINNVNNDNKKEEIYKEEKIKKVFGLFKNVFLSDEEYVLLKKQFVDCDKRIEALSRYIASKGNKYENHYATILDWASRDGNIETPSCFGENLKKNTEGLDELEKLLEDF